MLTNKEKIEAINKFQECEFMHELQCGRHGCSGILKPFESLGKVMLICPKCKIYTQEHIPDIVFHLDYSQFDEIKKFLDKARKK